MLTILFKILSILGIVILILLGIALAVILLVLFFPISYKFSGKKDTEEMQLKAGVKWLFGILRISYSYPVPGKILVKLLCFTLYDSSAVKPAPGKSTTTNTAAASDAVSSPPTEPVAESAPPKDENTGTVPPDNAPIPEKGIGRFRGFFRKIRYTLQKIYDKIKNILQNITFYKALWNDPDTQGLLRHAGKRLGHILKRLRPRKLTLTAVAGTGSPDTTGYLYGIYGMLLPKLGKGIYITPDFEQAILEGSFQASGHFTVTCVLFHSIRLVLDKRLRQLLHKIRQFQKNQQK